MAIWVCIPVQFIVLLVVIFRRIEYVEWRDLGNDGSVERTALIQRLFVLQGFDSLLLRMIEDSTAVLCAHVIALSVQRGWVVCLPKNFQQFLKSDLGRVVHDLQTLRVAGLPATDFLIGWVFDLAARVSGGDLDHALQGGENGLRAPEATVGQGGDLCGREGGIFFDGGVLHGLFFGWDVPGLCTGLNSGEHQYKKYGKEIIIHFVGKIPSFVRLLSELYRYNT